MDAPIYILVVDDNNENLRVVSNFLKEKNYKIALAVDGDSALKILDDNPIDLILLDVMMPGKDGYEVCSEIKANNHLTEIPIIFLTAKNSPEDIVRGFEAGGVDYLTKPFIRNELLARVKTHVENSRSKKKLLETIKTRDKLYSIIAHDIRGPFFSITSLVSMITDGDIEINEHTLNEILPLLGKTVKDTEILLNNLLEWTKLQTDNISINKQNLAIAPIIDDCVNLLNGNATAKNIVLKSVVKKEVTAYFDEVTVHTVFRNLISNAIKFTPDNGSIIITATLDSNYVAVKVKDTGEGMTDEVRKKIFEGNEIITTYGTNQEKGSGLGLRLVKDLITQNSGQLLVESSLGIGTEITVKIPTKETTEM